MIIDLHKPVRRICPHCLGHHLAVERSIWNLLRAGFNVIACGARYLGYVIATAFWLLLVITHPLFYSDYARPYIESYPRIGLWRKCRQCGASMLDGDWSTAALKCGSCGYNLKGNHSGTCPECGWAVPGMTRTLLHYEQTTGARRSPLKASPRR